MTFHGLMSMPFKGILGLITLLNHAGMQSKGIDKCSGYIDCFICFVGSTPIITC